MFPIGSSSSSLSNQLVHNPIAIASTSGPLKKKDYVWSSFDVDEMVVSSFQAGLDVPARAQLFSSTTSLAGALDGWVVGCCKRRQLGW